MPVFKSPTKSWTPKELPRTPYDNAKAEWDDRIGSARTQARNWRMAALGLIGVSATLAGGLIYQSSKSMVTPYVVRVDNTTGVVEAIGRAPAEKYKPRKAEIDYFLSNFIQETRGLPTDPVVAKRDWVTAYTYLTPYAAQQMNAYVNANHPMARVGQESINVLVHSVVAVSAQSYQIQWDETHYDQNGTVTATHQYTGIFTIKIEPPHTQQALLINPLGIYITSFSWSRDV